MKDLENAPISWIYNIVCWNFAGLLILTVLISGNAFMVAHRLRGDYITWPIIAKSFLVLHNCLTLSRKCRQRFCYIRALSFSDAFLLKWYDIKKSQLWNDMFCPPGLILYYFKTVRLLHNNQSGRSSLKRAIAEKIPEDVEHSRTHLCSVLFQLCHIFCSPCTRPNSLICIFCFHLLNHLVVDSELDGCAAWNSVFLVSILSFNTCNYKKISNLATDMFLLPWKFPLNLQNSCKRHLV